MSIYFLIHHINMINFEKNLLYIEIRKTALTIFLKDFLKFNDQKKKNHCPTFFVVVSNMICGVR
jgi:hypothetical protein